MYSKSSRKQSSRRAICPMDRRFDSKATLLAQAVYLAIGSPLSLDLLEKSLRGDYMGVIDTAISVSDYTDANSFRMDYLATSLMSKYPAWELGIDRTAEALLRFKKAESECAAAAKRLSVTYVNGVYSKITPESLILAAQGKIRHLLGPFSWDSAELFFSFGPGATTTRPRREGDSYYKYREKPCSTPNCAVLAYTSIRRVPRWFHHVVSLTGRSLDEHESLPLRRRVEECINIVKGNRIAFVPKDAKKERTIAIEPTMNGYLQHGIGSLIRRRLRRVGIDLNDQTRNQELALEGSISDSLATVDLSAASDSVSLKLCEILLPEDWYEAICLTRSEVGTLPSGEAVKYWKVSSMGNGYTFELESLIFWALSRAVVDALSLRDRRVSIFGDDIIISGWGVPTLEWLLTFCGFSFNKEKSFVSGPFRESCGKHYFRGTDVTPIYVRECIDCPTRLIWFSNQIRRWSALSWGLDSTMQWVYQEAVSMLPLSLQRPSIPDGLGDYALFGDFDEAVPRRSSDGHDSYTAVAWLPVSKTREFEDIPFLLRQLASSQGSNKNPLAETRSILWHELPFWMVGRMEFVDNVYRVKDTRTSPRWRKMKIAVTQWLNKGPWL